MSTPLTIAIVALVGIAAVAFLSFSSAPSSTVETQFRDFLDTYRVGYGNSDEYSYRLSVFEDNLKTIAELNRKNPLATFAVNKFADRTKQEMKALRGLSATPKYRSVAAAEVADLKDVDWTGYWGKVKDQGQCGSCWAFSATAAYEARYHLSQGKSSVETYFAEQQLVDCDHQSEGCNGGLMDYAFQYLETHKFCGESVYKYTARDGKCKDSKCTDGPTVKGHTDLPDEAALLKELVNGPVSVAVDAEEWSFYSGGIVSDCGTDQNILCYLYE